MHYLIKRDINQIKYRHIYRQIRKIKINSTKYSIISYTFNLIAQCDDTLPILEDFTDSSVIGVCWNVIDADGDGNNWCCREYGASYGGYKCLTSRSSSSTGYLNPDNWIIYYPIDLTSYSPQ
jgi:hypothetical protein